MTDKERSRSSIFSGSLQSLRDDIVLDNNQDCVEDEDDFVFTDHMHQRKEFAHFNEALTEFGLMTGGADDESNEGDDGEEKNPLVTKATDTNNEEEKHFEEKAETKKASSIPYRRKSKIEAYNHGQRESFLAVLDRIDQIQEKTRNDKGFKEWKFTFGLVNCLLIAYIHGSHPEHFWILYAVETIFWMSYKLKGMYYAKPLCEVLYYLDFCWVMNTIGAAFIVLTILLDGFFNTNTISVEVRKKVFLASFGIFCGPIFLAAMALPFVAFLFHDVNTMANLIIHLMPSMVMYNLRWHADQITASYPTIFPHLKEITANFNNNKNIGSVSRITLMVYFAWFIPYTLWMLLIGLKLPVISKDKTKPAPKYDTVFHSTWKGGLCEMVGTVFWKRSKKRSRDCSERNDYEVRDFVLYMIGHAVGSCGVGIIILGDILCYRGGKTTHVIILLFATVICAKRGADRYAYYVTKMYGQKLRKAFLDGKKKEQELQYLSKLPPMNANYGAIVEEGEDSAKED
mmetsp:Transcript_7385/g.21480  ORF Transcript_7385/g.21480 Transcript_7385/m.21480 type:complete len:513 (-) Transcript_7385:2423-3961(-)